MSTKRPMSTKACAVLAAAIVGVAALVGVSIRPSGIYDPPPSSAPAPVKTTTTPEAKPTETAKPTPPPSSKPTLTVEQAETELQVEICKVYDGSDLRYTQVMATLLQNGLPPAETGRQMALAAINHCPQYINSLSSWVDRLSE